MSGYMLVNCEGWYDSSVEIHNVRWLNCDSTLREIADLAIEYFVAHKTRRAEWNTYQIVRLFKSGDNDNDYNVFVGDFCIDVWHEFTFNRPEELEVGVYLQYIPDNDSEKCTRWFIENKKIVGDGIEEK